METRTFGKTGAEVTIMTLGGCALGNLSQRDANKAIELAVNRHGINIIDVAPSYGEAELRLHDLISERRDEFFLAEKTTERTKNEAWNDLQSSLDNLGTDYFDLYQFHAVGDQEDINTIFGTNGAMEAFLEAKDSDIIKNIGITGHKDARIILQALHKFDFDTILFPINVASKVNLHPQNDYTELLNYCEKHNIGVSAIKALAKRRWRSDEDYETWYEPIEELDFMTKSLAFTLSQPGVVTSPLPCDIRLWQNALQAMDNFKMMGENEMDKFIKIAKQRDIEPLFPKP